MATVQYPIKTSADEFTRLAIQSDLCREDARAMLDRIGDGSGLRVLDLCCGTGGITDVLSAWVGATGSVIGADLDTAKLDYAAKWAEANGLTNVTFREAWTIEGQLKETPRHSSDRTKVRTLERGETLSHLAAREYQDAGAWRLIADANDVDNPRLVAPGTRLVVPRANAPSNGGRAP